MLVVAISAVPIELGFVALVVIEDNRYIYVTMSNSYKVKGEVTTYLDFERL
jgi:hypothetical protein